MGGSYGREEVECRAPIVVRCRGAVDSGKLLSIWMRGKKGGSVIMFHLENIKKWINLYV